MLYVSQLRFPPRRSDDTDHCREPHELLDDLAVLVEAGLVVAVRDADGQLRMTPAEPQEESDP
jgi:hypothetical protein